MTSKFTSGRKKENSVWDYFSYDKVSNKSTCLVVETTDYEKGVLGVKSSKICKAAVKTNFSTNLLNHLKFHHKSTHSSVIAKEVVRKQIASKSTKTATSGKLTYVALPIKFIRSY